MGGGYCCPRCGYITEELPSECAVCGLTLVSSSHLSRSCHHLFPVPVFDEIQDAEQKVGARALLGSAVGGPT